MTDPRIWPEDRTRPLADTLGPDENALRVDTSSPVFGSASKRQFVVGATLASGSPTAKDSSPVIKLKQLGQAPKSMYENQLRRRKGTWMSQESAPANLKKYLDTAPRAQAEQLTRCVQLR